MLSFLVCLAWIYLAVGRGFFWVVREPRKLPPLRGGARVVAVIPARDEAPTIGLAVQSLAPLPVVVVDDQSADGTGAIAAAAGARVVPGAPLPTGWTGKLWAVRQGVEAARELEPEYLLLTDADIVHGPGEVEQLIARAESGGFDLVSLMVKLRCESFAERALIPAFVFFFFKLYPPGAKTRGAAGGCMLIRRAALERIGGIEKIRSELIDDCALAREVRRSGGKIRLGKVWLGVTHGTRSLREYPTLASVESMIARTAFTQLGYSPWMLAGAVCGMALLYVSPPLFAVAGSLWGIAAWVLMSIVYLPVLRFYGRSPLWALCLPVIALFYTGATIDSAVRYWTGKGGLWKGRVQAR